ncbi:MAG: hypothetical protein ISR69_03390 [Gammaproteobacteria bacterium]|nr:hypothetical protein [Gammaproteobacteria bacterium]
MKNQYFGDINDYKKFGLLRSILSATKLKILVSWMLTEDDGSTDGKFIEYLSEPDQWAKYDTDLYEEITVLLQQKTKRAVNLIESSKILGDTQYFSNIVPDHSENRITWLSELKKCALDKDLVFLDPDNGIEIKSKKFGTKNSSKFIYWREIEELWASGKSLLIYQHFIREKREVFIQRMLNSLSEKTETSIVKAFSTSNVVFLLALQPKHQNDYERIINTVRSNWKDQIACSEISS